MLTKSDIQIVGRLYAEERQKFQQNREVYNSEGLICALRAMHCGNPPRVLVYEPE